MNKAGKPPGPDGGQVPPPIPGLHAPQQAQQIQIATRSVPVTSKGNGDMLDLTPEVTRLLNSIGMHDGQVILFVPGSTASLTTIEFEHGLKQDFPAAFDRIMPRDIPYEHDKTWHDGNGHSHVRASTVGPSLTVPFTQGRLTLGTWQQIVLVDWDNRQRTRDVVIQFWGV
ncbi:secondary thiamine-phosphate synthase enzyme YjbQ [bacterium]|nr:secondary thiamine-phosphate synthase enzyme YjbQ [bacterium]